ncbi:hypothetical protein CAPTEDRAFT_201825 [Capitella teleta]|uniref:G-protein coupled receptors family 1 profile domain-containing protein n=1 Tax=Capitella teleta TaxID=283909 RepID=R7U5B9_CAPTE|nr:hypothetical protein CAPTEDRAFT_201825 [Capitella teleta]|eukprot:ELU01565.1 hypothetical protein CAPTEDRAFT_201825 [Capitella teleta]
MRVMLVILVAETKLRFSQLFACEGVVFTKVQFFELRAASTIVTQECYFKCTIQVHLTQTRLTNVRQDVQPSAGSMSFNASTAASFVNESLDLRYRHPNLYEEFTPLATFADKYLLPVWYVVGIPGNILAFIIWIQPKMRPSSGCYLAALAMDDLVFLFLKFFFELTNTWALPIFNVPVLCEVFPVIFLASQYYDPVLVLGFTVERYISICHPFQREKFCSTRRAVKVIAGLLLCCVLLHAVQGYFWYYSSETQQCSVRLAITLGNNASIWTVWSWITELLVFGLVPLTILILNIMVILEVRKMSASEEKRMCLKKGHKTGGQTSATTFMLLVVSFYLIFTTLPVTVCYALNLNFREGEFLISDEELLTDSTWQRHFNFTTVRRLLENFGMSHYACNFYLYMMTGKVFRKEFRRIFLAKCTKDKSASSTMGLSAASAPLRDLNSNGSVAHV